MLTAAVAMLALVSGDDHGDHDQGEQGHQDGHEHGQEGGRRQGGQGGRGGRRKGGKGAQSRTRGLGAVPFTTDIDYNSPGCIFIRRHQISKFYKYCGSQRDSTVEPPPENDGGKIAHPIAGFDRPQISNPALTREKRESLTNQQSQYLRELVQDSRNGLRLPECPETLTTDQNLSLSTKCNEFTGHHTGDNQDEHLCQDLPFIAKYCELQGIYCVPRVCKTTPAADDALATGLSVDDIAVSSTNSTDYTY